MLINDLLLFQRHTQEYLIEQAISNSHLALHNEENLKDLCKLVLNYVTPNCILPRFKFLQQLDNLVTEALIRYLAVNDAAYLVFVSEGVPKLIEKVLENILDINLLNCHLWQLLHKPFVNACREGLHLVLRPVKVEEVFNFGNEIFLHRMTSIVL